MKAKIETITLKYGEKTLELTTEEAEDILSVLQERFLGKREIIREIIHGHNPAPDYCPGGTWITQGLPEHWQKPSITFRS